MRQAQPGAALLATWHRGGVAADREIRRRAGGDGAGGLHRSNPIGRVRVEWGDDDPVNVPAFVHHVAV